jgi:DNA-binding transcriptional regulator YiaG
MDEMDGPAIRDARQRFRLSADGFAKLVGVESGRTVRRWEAGTRDVPGPVRVLMRLLLACPAARKMLGVTLYQPGEAAN